MTLTAKENLLQAIRHEAPEYVPYMGEGVCRFVDCRGRRPPRQGADEWGVTWAPLPEVYVPGEEEPAASYAVSHPARSVADLLDRPFPDGAGPALFDGLLEGIDSSQVLAIGRHPAGPLDRLVSLMGMAGALLAMVREPAGAAEVLGRIADYHVGIARGYLAAGVEAGGLADDYAGDTGPFIRLALWREMLLPGLARVLAVYRQAGVPVFFHTCGRAEELVLDLVEAGVTVFNLESAACDLPALKARFGRRIAFLGGVSARLLLSAGPEAVRQAARAAMWALGREGGLILAPDQPLRFPPENEAALYETARRHGRYPLADCGADR